jgi:antitoxin MazE
LVLAADRSANSRLGAFQVLYDAIRPRCVDMLWISDGGRSMSIVTVGRWGNSLAIRIPGDIAACAGLRDGEPVEVEAATDGLLVRRAIAPIKLADLFADRAPEEWRALYADAFDWGPDVGRERIE